MIDIADSTKYLNGLPNQYCDCIITDPVYAEMYDLNVLQLINKCKGNVLVFCDPLNRPRTDPDEILFWIKTPSTKNTSRNCSRFVEEIMVYRRGTTFNRLHWSCMTGVFTDTIIDNPTYHPWQKPTSLIEKLIRIYSNPGDLVIDPFCGSGTTGVAAKNTGRRFLGIEIDPDTAEIARNRIDGNTSTQR